MAKARYRAPDERLRDATYRHLARMDAEGRLKQPDIVAYLVELSQRRRKMDPKQFLRGVDAALDMAGVNTTTRTSIWERVQKAKRQGRVKDTLGEISFHTADSAHVAGWELERQREDSEVNSAIDRAREEGI